MPDSNRRRLSSKSNYPKEFYDYEKHSDIMELPMQNNCNAGDEFVDQIKLKPRPKKMEMMHVPRSYSRRGPITCFVSENLPQNIQRRKSAAPMKDVVVEVPTEKPKIDPENVPMDWDNYHRLKVIHNFMEGLEREFPSLCTTGIIGKSLEGRDLKILKISNSEASNSCVWIDAGIHAREWIAPAVNTYIANHIARNFDCLPDSVRSKDWYFMPVLNPDGYEYSHTTYRMWRKNKAYVKHHMTGVDLNRNFSYGWGGKGSSNEPKHAFYRGSQPFSEPESAAVRDIFLNSGIRFKVYITLHSFGQVIIMPFACSENLAPNYISLLEGATVMSKAIYDTNGNTYKVGVSKDVMYPASGTSNDWSHGEVGIPFCYLIELRSRKHKFKLPKEEIAETGAEILSCVIALMEFVDNYKTPKIGKSIISCSDIVEESDLINLKIKEIKRHSVSEDLTSEFDVKSEQIELLASQPYVVKSDEKETERGLIAEDGVSDFPNNEVSCYSEVKTKSKETYKDLSYCARKSVSETSGSISKGELEVLELLISSNSEEDIEAKEIIKYSNHKRELNNCNKQSKLLTACASQNFAVNTQAIHSLCDTESGGIVSDLDTESDQIKLRISRLSIINTEEKETERSSIFEILRSDIERTALLEILKTQN